MKLILHHIFLEKPFSTLRQIDGVCTYLFPILSVIFIPIICPSQRNNLLISPDSAQTRTLVITSLSIQFWSKTIYLKLARNQDLLSIHFLNSQGWI